MIIGQTELLNTLDTLVESGFPRFIILLGNKGSGKKLIAREISRKLGASFVEADIKVDAVREVISTSYKVAAPTLYLLPEIDKMSIAAKNALLKVTEEAPRKAYFVLTVTDLNSVLATLKSRGTILKMDDYTPADLLQYCDETNIKLYKTIEDIILNVCTNFYEIELLHSYGEENFYDFCLLTAENIGDSNLGNALKIGTRLKFKDDGEGYDPQLFMRTIIFIYNKMIKENMSNPDYTYLQAMKLTSKYLSELGATGVSKSATIDTWIIEMQEVFNNG